MQNIAPCLWFDDRIEEAVNFYVSVFPNAKVRSKQQYGDGGPLPKGKVLSMTFELDGLEFIAINGGAQFKFTEAISLLVHCKAQAEVDRYWQTLTANGGQESMCGWLKDKYGLSWQIVPDDLYRYLNDKDPRRASRAMQAMLKMKKIDIAEIKRAAAG